jgi:hypothetical protein
MQCARPLQYIACHISLVINRSRRTAAPGLAFSARLRPAIPRGAEGLHCRFSICGIAVLRPIAALPLEEVERAQVKGGCGQRVTPLPVPVVCD